MSSLVRAAAPEPDVGLGHWQRQRELWTVGHTPYSETPEPHAYRRVAYFADIGTAHFANIYTALVVNGRRCSRPMPLDLVIQVIFRGWQLEGLWPADEPARGSRAGS